MTSEEDKRYVDLGKEMYPKVFKHLKAKHDAGLNVYTNDVYELLLQDGRFAKKSAKVEANGYFTICDMFNNTLKFKKGKI